MEIATINKQDALFSKWHLPFKRHVRLLKYTGTV